VDTSAEKANELDRALIQLEHGVDIAMQVSPEVKYSIFFMDVSG